MRFKNSGYIKCLKSTSLSFLLQTQNWGTKSGCHLLSHPRLMPEQALDLGC